MGLQSPLSKGGAPVPGGKSQKGTASSMPGYSKGGGGSVGSKRGLVGSGTADVLARTPAQQGRSAPGNYGGGYAGLTRKATPASGRSGADRRG